MSDLDELARSARASMSRPTSYAGRSGGQERSPVLQGLLMAMGAAPVLLAVLILASYLDREILKAQVRNAVEQIRQVMPAGR